MKYALPLGLCLLMLACKQLKYPPPDMGAGAVEKEYRVLVTADSSYIDMPVGRNRYTTDFGKNNTIIIIAQDSVAMGDILRYLTEKSQNQ